jgi:hypothetical protein
LTKTDSFLLLNWASRSKQKSAIFRYVEQTKEQTKIWCLELDYGLAAKNIYYGL